MIIEKYQTELNDGAGNFKSSLLENMSNYLDLYLEKTFPQGMLEEAIKNKRADNILAEVRKLLAVDMALAKDEIKDAVIDGKQQISEANTKLDVVGKENVRLVEENSRMLANQTLSELAANLPDHKKQYIFNVLGNKTSEFISENFEYTLELFDKEQDKKRVVLKEEATKTVRGNVDAVTEPIKVENGTVIEESTDEKDPLLTAYMGELGQY